MWGTIGGTIASIFTGGATKTVENIAKEWIDTDIEKAQAGHIDAEAKSLFIKTLDPNGKMRRNLATFASWAYGYYLLVTSVLIFVVAFKFGDVDGAKLASKLMTDLFTPITASWATIVTASFGVNGINTIKGK